jgi:WS/DGAT/MGAT family acyltransferase
VSERLSSADTAFFYVERPDTPQHVGGLAVFAAPDGFDYDRLLRLLDERISLAPRYRQKMRTVPGNLANPVWLDDSKFDLTYHVRRSGLHRPGRDAALLEFCARIQSRLLDRSRPLWEMYLVEGLADGRVAVITKTHPAIVDGDGGIDITQVLLDESPEPRRTVAPQWRARREPSGLRLMAEAVCDTVRSPAVLIDAARLSGRDARTSAKSAVGAVSGVAASVGGSVLGAARHSERSPLRAKLGKHRRIAIERARLADFRRVRDRRGGTVNDVVLAVVAGALRAWLLSRREPLVQSSTVRALVPIGVNGPDAPSPGWTRASRVTGVLVDLPVGEPDPLRRLALIQQTMQTQAVSGHPVGADVLAGLSGFAPPTLHSLGVRAAQGLARRQYSVVVTNVPGPQLPRYAAGARMTEMFPILPLNSGQALAIAATSYDGGVYFGVNADRDAVPDVDLVASSLGTAIDQLVAASTPVDIGSGAPRRRARGTTRT